MLAELLALSASFFWGGSNIMAGLESRRRSAWTVSVVSHVAAALGAGAALLIAAQHPPDFWHALAPLLGGAVGGLGTIAFYFALARGAMSLVSPIVAAQVAVPVAVGLVRGERPGLLAYLGMACAVGGVLLVCGARGGRRDRADRSVVLLAVCAALCWGIMLVGFNIGGKQSVYWSVFDTRAAAAGIVLIVFVLGGRRLELAGDKLAVLFVLASIGLLLALANVVFTVASTLGYLSVGAILGSLSPLLTTAYGQLRLDERLSACQWWGAGTVLLGVVLLAL